MSTVSKQFHAAALLCCSAAAAGGGYLAHKNVVAPAQQEQERLANYTQRGERVLTSLFLKPIEMKAFEKAAQGCDADAYGASFVAEDRDSKIVYGVMCVSDRSELTFRVLR